MEAIFEPILSFSRWKEGNSSMESTLFAKWKQKWKEQITQKIGLFPSKYSLITYPISTCSLPYTIHWALIHLIWRHIFPFVLSLSFHTSTGSDSRVRHHCNLFSFGFITHHQPHQLIIQRGVTNTNRHHLMQKRWYPEISSCNILWFKSASWTYSTLIKTIE